MQDMELASTEHKEDDQLDLGDNPLSECIRETADGEIPNMPLSVTSDQLHEQARWSTSWVSRSRDGARFLLFALLLIAMQYRSGAFTVDLASDADEPAHAVSSLMVHDYLTQAFPRSPLKSAWMFYAHYPKVAIGHWPPLFYCGEALWMLIAGRSQRALLLFVALCGAALLSSIYFEVRRQSSAAAAMVSVSVLLTTGIFQKLVCGVHPDLLLALVIFWAAIYCADFMAFESPRSRNLYLGFGTAALLVHGRGGVVLLLPFCLLVLRRRVVNWKWLVAGLAVLLFMLLMPHAIHEASSFSVIGLPERAYEFLAGVVTLTGWLGTMLALVGLWRLFTRDSQRPFWAAMAGVGVCGLVFHLLVPVPFDSRYMMPTLVAVAALAGGGTQTIVERVSRASSRRRRALYAAIGTASLVSMAIATACVPAKPDHGYRGMIANCLLCGDEVTLVAGGGVDEGGLIAEASLADPMRLHTVLRASKVLAETDWSRSYTQLRFASAAEVDGFLDQAGVSQVVLGGESQYEEDIQLRAAMTRQGSGWEREPRVSGANRIEIYRRMRPE